MFFSIHLSISIGLSDSKSRSHYRSLQQFSGVAGETEFAAKLISILDSGNTESDNETRALIIRAIALSEDSRNSFDRLVNNILKRKPEVGGLPLSNTPGIEKIRQSLGYRAGLLLNKEQTMDVNRILVAPLMSIFRSNIDDNPDAKAKKEEAKSNALDFQEIKGRDQTKTSAGIGF